MARYSEAQNKASQKYQKKTYDTYLLRFKKEGAITMEAVAKAAEDEGESLQGYIMKAIEERIARLENEEH